VIWYYESGLQNTSNLATGSIVKFGEQAFP